MQRLLLAWLAAGLIAPASASADSGITPPVRLADVAGAGTIGIDSAQRIYAVGGGRATVLSPEGAPLATWSVPQFARAAVLPFGGIVTGDEAGELTRWSPDGAPLSKWSMGGPVISVAADPHGSVLVRDAVAERQGLLWRFWNDGTSLGWAPFGRGDATVAPNGRAWLASGTTVAGYTADGTPLGHECPIGGGSPPCVAGAFAPAGAPLSVAATSDGGVLVADPGRDALDAFAASGSPLFACANPLGAERVVAAAVRDRTVVLASKEALYTATLTPSSPGCRDAPLRVEHLRFRRGAIAFTLSRPARVHVLLHRVARVSCWIRSITPSPDTKFCTELGGLRRLRPLTGSAGANSVALGRLEPDCRWVATIVAGSSVVAGVPFATTRQARAAGRVRAGSRARGR